MIWTHPCPWTSASSQISPTSPTSPTSPSRTSTTSSPPPWTRTPRTSSAWLTARKRERRRGWMAAAFGKERQTKPKKALRSCKKRKAMRIGISLGGDPSLLLLWYGFLEFFQVINFIWGHRSRSCTVVSFPTPMLLLGARRARPRRGRGRGDDDNASTRTSSAPGVSPSMQLSWISWDTTTGNNCPLSHS